MQIPIPMILISMMYYPLYLTIIDEIATGFLNSLLSDAFVLFNLSAFLIANIPL